MTADEPGCSQKLALIEARAAAEEKLLLSSSVLNSSASCKPTSVSNSPGPLVRLSATSGSCYRGLTGRVIMVDPLQRGDYLDLMTEIVLRSDEMASAYEAEFGQPIARADGIDNAGQQRVHRATGAARSMSRTTRWKL